MGINWCGRPNGNSVFVPMLFTTCAFFLSNRGSRWCDYLYRETANTNLSDSTAIVSETDAIFAFSRHFGPWGYGGLATTIGPTVNFMYCYEFSESFVVNVLDTKWRAAMSFPIIVTIIGGIIMIITWFSPCLRIAPKWWRFMAIWLLLACLLEGLTFLLLSSDVCTADYVGTTDWVSKPTCSLTRGGHTAIAATVFWFAAAVSMFKVSPLPPEDEPIIVQRTTTTTETTKPDGTKVTETKVDTDVVDH